MTTFLGVKPDFEKHWFMTCCPIQLCMCVIIFSPDDGYLPNTVWTFQAQLWSLVSVMCLCVWPVSPMQCLYTTVCQWVSCFWFAFRHGAHGRYRKALCKRADSLTNQTVPTLRWDISNSACCCFYQVLKQYWNTLWSLLGFVSPHTCRHLRHCLLRSAGLTTFTFVPDLVGCL